MQGEPENYWYAEILINIVEARKSVLEDIKDELPFNNSELKSNIAEIYFLKGDYVTAKSILKELKSRTL